MAGSQTQTLRIGLTGGIASGKSAVTKLFAQLGATIIDTDLIARAVVAPGQPGLVAITSAFGPAILQKDGTLDRGRMRKRVFADATAKTKLEAILHPLIKAQTLEQAAANERKGPYQILAVPLLVETGFLELVDRVLVVDCPVEMQIQRVMARDNVTAAEATAAVGAQAERSERLAHADDTIVNDGALADLAKPVRELHAQYLMLADH